MKILFDFLPIILFFAAYLIKGIQAATAVAIVASIALFAWIYLKGNKPNLMQWFSVVVIILFGGTTLLLEDPIYIQWKPTALYLLMGTALLLARYVFKLNLLKKVIGNKIDLPPPVWDKLNLMWFGFFLFIAVINLIVVYNFSQDVWAYFKMFGTLILTFLFVIAQSFYLAPFMEEIVDSQPSSQDEAHDEESK